MCVAIVIPQPEREILRRRVVEPPTVYPVRNIYPLPTFRLRIVKSRNRNGLSRIPVACCERKAGGRHRHIRQVLIIGDYRHVSGRLTVRLHRVTSWPVTLSHPRGVVPGRRDVEDGRLPRRRCKNRACRDGQRRQHSNDDQQLDAGRASRGFVSSYVTLVTTPTNAE